MEDGMEAMHDNHMPFPEENSSSANDDRVEAFENNLREDNLRLLRSLRLQEMMGKIKSDTPEQWPFK